ncbi:MAG: hypothetical protein ACPGO7_01465 [Alphaproteobacteria bacterium]
MSSREHYTISAMSIQELTTQLNFALARIADRVDKLEGVRGNPTFESDIDLQTNKITDMSSGTASTDGVRLDQLSDQGLDTTDGPTFASLTVLGDLVVGDDTSIGDYIFIQDTNGTVIHQFGDDTG